MLVQINYIQANPGKFQFITFSKTNTTPLDLETGIVIEPLRCVNILGGFVHNMLSFKEHVAYVSKNKQTWP